MQSSEGGERHVSGFELLSTLSNMFANASFRRGDRSPSPLDDDSEPADTTFDKTRAAKHEYLGSDLEELRGRTLHDEGSVIWLPILLELGVVLVPGQTLPLTVYYPPTIAMLREIIAKDKTFGVIGFRGAPHQNNVAKVGTTAEIFQYQEESDLAGFKIKAKGRQRFRLLEQKHQDPGILLGKVIILPEVTLPSPLHSGRLTCLDKYRCNSSMKHKNSSYDSAVTPWPEWVYRQYDPSRLGVKVINELKSFEPDITSSALPTNPNDLSYWVAQSLPIDDKQRLGLLSLDTAVERLQNALTLLSKVQKWYCSRCDNRVADRNDVFSMSIDGPQGTYCNPGGHVHEIMTLYKATGLHLENEPPSTEYSWFPGYGWTAASCGNCRRHMGWQFTAMTSDLKPHKFWGLSRRYLTSHKRPTNRDDHDHHHYDFALDSMLA